MQETKSKLFSVAKYILKKTGKITAMKLQKLVYYCQVWNLAWYEMPLFPEEFEAWPNGPVCTELYKIHEDKFELSLKDFKGIKSARLTDRDKMVIDMVINDYGKEPPLVLSYLTHSERPWKESRGNTPPGMSCDNIISKKLMQSYYSGLLAVQ